LLNDEKELAKLMLEKGVSTDPEGNVLAVAIKRDQQKIVDLLIGKGISKDYSARALSAAIEKSDMRTIKLLLKKNISKDPNNQALLAANKTGQKEIIKLLLDKGINKVDRRTVSLLVGYGNYNLALDMLKTIKNPYQMVLNTLVEKKEYAFLKMMLKEIVSNETRIDAGCYLLKEFLEEGRMNLAELMLKRKISIDFASVLLNAIDDENVEAVKLLVSYGSHYQTRTLEKAENFLKRNGEQMPTPGGKLPASTHSATPMINGVSEEAMEKLIEKSKENRRLDIITNGDEEKIKEIWNILLPMNHETKKFAGANDFLRIRGTGRKLLYFMTDIYLEIAFE